MGNPHILKFMKQLHLTDEFFGAAAPPGCLWM